MNPLIKLLLEGGGLSTTQMAQVLNLTEAEVNRQLDNSKRTGSCWAGGRC